METLLLKILEPLNDLCIAAAVVALVTAAVRWRFYRDEMAAVGAAIVIVAAIFMNGRGHLGGAGCTGASPLASARSVLPSVGCFDE